MLDGAAPFCYSYTVNALMKNIIMVVAAAPACVCTAAPAVMFTAAPQHLQLYPRAWTNNTASVPVSGCVVSTGYAAIALAVTRLGAPYANATQLLMYGTNGAWFSFATSITAELAHYTFTVSVLGAGFTDVVAVVTNVVVGDVVLVNGQSNAEAAKQLGTANSNRHDYVRSFGYREENVATVRNGTNWYVAEGDAWTGPGAVGQWALRMGRVLMERNGVPIALINGARGGMPIAYFQRNDHDKEDLTTNYGRLLYRSRCAGVAGAARVMIYYQGESDEGNARDHARGFTALLAAWRADYAALARVYVFQVRVGCMVQKWDGDLRNRQRLWPDADPLLTVMSTTGVAGHDGCHYYYENGYRLLGEGLARMVLRDVHGVPMPAASAPPNLAYAQYADAAGTSVVIVTRNGQDLLACDAGSYADFRMEGLPYAIVLSVRAVSNTLVVGFDRDVRAGQRITYAGHAGAGPLITNLLGMGLLTFWNEPVLSVLAPPAAPANVAAWPVSVRRVDVSWPSATNAAHYRVRRNGADLAVVSTPGYCDRAVATNVPYSYEVAGINWFGTSAWSAPATCVLTAGMDTVYQVVPEARDFEILYLLDGPGDVAVGATQDVAYDLDNSGAITAGLQRIAYYLELRATPGSVPRWVYVSLDPLTTNAALLGVPVAFKGATFQRMITNMNVYAANGAVRSGFRLATGNIEFWGRDYDAYNYLHVANANNTAFDHGDRIGSAGTYGSMQLHNYDLDGAGAGTTAQTLFALNHWGAVGIDDVGIGSRADANTDWTFARNATQYAVRLLYVLARVDADADGMADKWERDHFGTLDHGGGEDADGDACANAREYVADTDPRDSNSWLRLTVALSNQQVWLTLPASPARLYQPIVSTNVTDTAWQAVAGLTNTTAATLTLRVPAVTTPHGAYRVRIEVP